MSVSQEVEFGADVLTIAVEGGFHNWAYIKVDRFPPGDSDVSGYVRRVTYEEDVETGDLIRAIVTVHDVIAFAKKWRWGDFDGASINSQIRKEIHEAVLQLDACPLDAISADVIIQLILFGEIVYG